MMRASLAAAAWLLVLMPLSAVHAQNDSISAEERERDARALFDMASRHYETGRLEEAIQEFERAYTLYPVPAFQYNLYLANRDAGNLSRAALALRTYLDSESEMDPARRASLERRHQLLTANVERNGAGPPDGDASTDTTPDSSVTATDPSGMTRDPVVSQPVETSSSSSGGLSPVVGAITLGVGGALLIGSLALGLVANGKKSELDEVCNDAGCLEAQQSEIVSTFETHRNVAWGLLYSGVAVAATGVVLLLLSGGDDSEVSDSTAGISCDRSGCLGSYEHRF